MVPELPRQQIVVAVDMRVKASIGHELVDKQELAAAMAPADELHEVAVPQPAYDLHLGDVLLPTLFGAL